MIGKLLRLILPSPQKKHDFCSVEFVSALDDQTCLDCLELDGMVYDIEKTSPVPLHQGCRCALVPYLPEIRELEEKAKRNGINIPPSIRSSKMGPIREDGGVYKSYLLERGREMRTGKKGKELTNYLRGRLRS